MDFNPDELRRILDVLDANTNSFAELAIVAGLKPDYDFCGADLRNVNFGTDDLGKFSFRGADLRGADFSRAISLRKSMFVGARRDETTRWPSYIKFSEKAARLRVKREVEVARVPSSSDRSQIKSSKESLRSRTRGIFHPAFLDVMQKSIVIELLAVRSMQKIQKAFEEGSLDFVTASFVRGTEDVLIRRYVDRGSLGPRAAPILSFPHSRLNNDEFSAAFDTEPTASHLIFLVRPQGIRKFRGARIDNTKESEWLELCEQIVSVVHRRNALEEIVALATEVPRGTKIPEKYHCVFSPGVETLVPIGAETQLRDTHLLISAEQDDGPATNQFLDFLNAQVIDDPRIRDIYELTSTQASPMIGQRPFQFMLRLKCNAFEIDEVLGRMATWASEANVRLGTRSYDTWKSIKSAATQGILASSLRHEELELMEALIDINPKFVFETPEIQLRFSEAVMNHSMKIRSHYVSREVFDDLTKFMHYVCAFNTTAAAAKRNTYKEAAATKFSGLYKFMETAARSLLLNVLELPSDATRHNVYEKIDDIGLEYFRESSLLREGGYLTWFSALYGNIIPSNAEASNTNVDVRIREISKIVRKNISPIMHLRNLAAHSVGTDFEQAITVGGKEWYSQFRELDAKLDAICELILALSSELTANTPEHNSRKEFLLDDLKILILQSSKERLGDNFISLRDGVTAPLHDEMTVQVPGEISNYGKGIYFDFALCLRNETRSLFDLSGTRYRIAFPPDVALADDSLKLGHGKLVQNDGGFVVAADFAGTELGPSATHTLMFHLRTTANANDLTRLRVSVTISRMAECFSAEFFLKFAPLRRMN